MSPEVAGVEAAMVSRWLRACRVSRPTKIGDSQVRTLTPGLNPFPSTSPVDSCSGGTGPCPASPVLLFLFCFVVQIVFLNFCHANARSGSSKR